MTGGREPLRVAFAGTPEFAACALGAIVEAGFCVPVVLTQPDRPAGRGMKLTASAVKQLAQTHNLPVLQPVSLRDEAQRAATLAACGDAPDVLVVAAYGLLLPQAVLDWPRLGCINIHASLLPRWRGAAPIHRAIEAGDERTGITLMQMDAGLDTGAMLARESLDIGQDDTTATLHDRLAALGADKSGAVYVGDSEMDVETARNAGLPLIAVSWGFRSREALTAAGVETVADTPEELLARLL